MNIILHQTAADVPSEGPIVLRTQATVDVAALEGHVPHDQSRLFRAVWQGRDLILEPVQVISECAAAPGASGEPKSTPPSDGGDLAKMSEESLQVEAAKAGVEWDRKASKDTMVKRITAARAKAAAK